MNGNTAGPLSGAASSATEPPIQIVSMPNLERIKNYLNDSLYRETIEISASFNTRLSLERKMRRPFFCAQTGVAQNNCSLYMSRRQRMPGVREGQIYTYPSARWRKSKRQYLIKQQTSSSQRPFRQFKQAGSLSELDADVAAISAAVQEDSSSLGACDSMIGQDSVTSKDDLPKDWFYDEMDIPDMDGSGPDGSGGDSDYDYNINGYKRKKKKTKPIRSRAKDGSGDTPRKGRPPGSGSGSGTRRGRRKNALAGGLGLSAVEKGLELEEQSYTPAFEPPSFDTAGGMPDDLRSYRKFL